MPVVNLGSLGAILALLVLVLCIVALALSLLGTAAALPAWLVIALIGLLAVSRLT